jgi:hypothetical protein
MKAKDALRIAFESIDYKISQGQYTFAEEAEIMEAYDLIEWALKEVGTGNTITFKQDEIVKSHWAWTGEVR